MKPVNLVEQDQPVLRVVLDGRVLRGWQVILPLPALRDGRVKPERLGPLVKPDLLDGRVLKGWQVCLPLLVPRDGPVVLASQDERDIPDGPVQQAPRDGRDLKEWQVFQPLPVLRDGPVVQVSQDRRVEQALQVGRVLLAFSIRALSIFSVMLIVSLSPLLVKSGISFLPEVPVPTPLLPCLPPVNIKPFFLNPQLIPPRILLLCLLIMVSPGLKMYFSPEPCGPVWPSPLPVSIRPLLPIQPVEYSFPVLLIILINGLRLRILPSSVPPLLCLLLVSTRSSVPPRGPTSL